MVSRRSPRAVWLPALVLWAPLVALGMWLVMGVHFDTTSVGTKEWRVDLDVPSPPYWFSGPEAIIGSVFLALGIAAWSVSLMQPDWRRWVFVVARYPEFAMAGHLLLLGAGLSLWRFTGSVFEVGSGGLTWRAIATLRSTTDMWISGALAVGAVACYVFSLGPGSCTLRAEDERHPPRPSSPQAHGASSPRH